MPVFPHVDSGFAGESACESRAVLQPPATEAQARQSVQAVRQMFARTLACWAGDLLTLRRRGLDVPHWSSPRMRRAA